MLVSRLVYVPCGLLLIVIMLVRLPRVRVATRGNWTDIKIQRKVIQFVLEELGEEEAFESAGGCTSRRTKLNATLKKAQAAILPQASIRQFRRWFYYFMAYGYTPADQRKERFRRPYRRAYARRGAKGN